MDKEKLVDQVDLNTMVDCINALTLKGFTEEFKLKDNGLQSISSKKIYKPEEVKIINFYRFEGNSDPSDNSILYAIETSDGKHGMLVDAFGPYADRNLSKFLSLVEEINKKV